MKRELAISLCILSMGVACGDDDPAPTNPAPTDPVAPRNGLVAEYQFSGNANDTGGNNDHGTVIGATLAADRFGNANAAYSFDGVDDEITCLADNFASGDNVSVSLWFNIDAMPPTSRYFAWCSDFVMFVHSAALGIVISIPASESASGTISAFNQWHHLLGTYDGTNVVAYINGVLVDTTNHPGNIDDPDDPLTFGHHFSVFYDGLLDDVRIYNRTITDTNEIYALYHEGGFGL